MIPRTLVSGNQVVAGSATVVSSTKPLALVDQARMELVLKLLLNFTYSYEF